MDAIREKSIAWYHEVWNNAQLDRVAEFVDENCKVKSFGVHAKAANGIQELKAVMQETLSALPNPKFKVLKTIVDGSSSATHWVCKVNVNGEEYNIDGLAIADWENGKMTTGSNGFDTAAVAKLLEK